MSMASLSCLSEKSLLNLKRKKTPPGLEAVAIAPVAVVTKQPEPIPIVP